MAQAQQPAPRSQAEMRRSNLSRVLHALAGGGPLSRAAVAARIGLTRAAVSTLVEELLRAGLVVERGPGRSGAVGRPGTELLLADRGPCGLGAEIGADHLAVCVMDLRGRVRTRIGQEARNQGSDPPAVLRRLDGLLRQAAGEAHVADLRPAGLTVAVPGLVTRGTSVVLRAPNLGWHGTDLARLLPGHLGPLTVDNEANLGALAEMWLRRGGQDGAPGQAAGALPGALPGPLPASFVHVSAEIGIGAAVVVDGELLRGVHGFAGELGHAPVRPDGRPCSCGSRGCLEAYAGEEAVLRAAGLAPGPGVRFAALAARCQAGEPTALRAVRRAGTALGIALAGAVNLLDPGHVVIGGALARLVFLGSMCDGST